MTDKQKKLLIRILIFLFGYIIGAYTMLQIVIYYISNK